MGKVFRLLKTSKNRTDDILQTKSDGVSSKKIPLLNAEDEKINGNVAIQVVLLLLLFATKRAKKSQFKIKHAFNSL